MLRLFVAVDLPASVQAATAALCDGLEGARSVNPRQLHITLRFLGATPEERLSEIERCLAEVRAPAFLLAVQGVGVFPAGARRPRVLWLGLEPAAPLAALKREIDRALDGKGETHPPVGKGEFRPHLTLARFPTKPGQGLAAFLAQHANYCGAQWEVATFHLYMSTLHPSGALHEKLATYGLGGI